MSVVMSDVLYRKILIVLQQAKGGAEFAVIIELGRLHRYRPRSITTYLTQMGKVGWLNLDGMRWSITELGKTALREEYSLERVLAGHTPRPEKPRKPPKAAAGISLQREWMTFLSKPLRGALCA